MALSENGNTFLLEGPPGTGKSKAASTILNVEGVERAAHGAGVVRHVGQHGQRGAERRRLTGQRRA